MPGFTSPEVIVTRLNDLTAERSLVVAVLVSILVAFVASRVRAFAFGSFAEMLAVLVAADIVVYTVMKLGFPGSSPGK